MAIEDNKGRVQFFSNVPFRLQYVYKNRIKYDRNNLEIPALFYFATDEIGSIYYFKFPCARSFKIHSVILFLHFPTFYT